MYITADGESETALASKAAKSVYGIGGPSSVDSTDVQKAGTVFTNTPDGRMRLTDYLNNVEKEIAAEEAARKRDVSAVRAQMARNFAFNQAARKKLNKFLLAKMAANAKKAKKDLDVAMRRTQAQFAAAAKPPTCVTLLTLPAPRRSVVLLLLTRPRPPRTLPLRLLLSSVPWLPSSPR